MPTIKLRRDTAANWTSVNPVLHEGEMGLETDTNKLKIGDGYNTWSDRGYINTDTAYGTFNPSSTRSYTGSSSSDGLGVKPIIAGDRNVIDNTGQGQIKIHTAETGSVERTIVSPNSGDANYVGWGGAGKLSADATFLATVEYEGSGVPSNALIHIHNLTTGALVNTVTRAIASTDYNGSEFNWGANIHLRGNYLLVSSSKGTAGGQTEAGSVQVYKTATGDWTDMALHGTVDNPSPAASDQWGDSISVLGEFALVGCPSKTVSSQANAGSVSVVHMENLTVVSTIDNPSPAEGDSFGSSVDFMTDYDHIAIGAEGDVEGSDDNSGAVYIYKTTIGDWTDGSQVARISNPNTNSSDPGDKFGSSVSSYGNYLAVAAKDEDNYAPGATGTVDYSQSSLDATLEGTGYTPGVRGAAGFGEVSAISSDGSYVVTGTQAAWVSGSSYTGEVSVIDTSTNSVVHTLNNPNSGQNYFGSGVAINSTLTAVGAKYETVNGQSRQGRVYIFSNATGSLVHTINSPNSGSNVHFGEALAMDETHLVIGEPNNTSSRKVHLYSVDSSSASLVWTSTRSDSENAWGARVALSDSYVAVGTYNGNAASVLSRSNGSILRTFTDPAGEGTEQAFGESISITDDYIAIGSEDWHKQFQGVGVGNYRSGRVYIYDPSNGNAVRTISNPNNSGTIWADHFGAMVSIKGDYLLASAPDEIYGSDEIGTCYIIDVTTGSTVKVITSANPKAGGSFGSSVQISDSGKFVIGANQEGTNNSGHLYVYEAPTGAPTGSSSGANYIFKTTDSTWTDTALCATLANPDTTPETADNDELSGISLGNDRFLAGYAAAGPNQGTGKVEEYDLYE
jgi:hypothetical protein